MSSARDYVVFSSVLLVTVLSCAGVALPYPVLAPLFMGGEVNGLNSYMGLSPELLLGIAISVYPLGAVIGSTFIGAMSDSYGRKSMLVVTLLGGAVGYLISAWAVLTEQYLLFIISRLFTGLCEGNAAIARAIALDLGKTIDKTRAMSLVSASAFIGWLIGPLSGGYLAEYGAEVVFEAGAFALAACAVFVWLAVAETTKVNRDKSFLTLLKSHNSLYLLKQPIMMQIFTLQMIYTLGLNAFYEFYPVWLVTERGFTPSGIGEITAVMTICMTLAAVLLMPKFKRMFGIKATMIVAMFSVSVIVAIIPSSESVMMVSLFAISGIGIAIYNGLLPVYMSDSCPEVGNGALMGLLTVTFYLSSTIIAFVGSLVLKLDHSAPIYLGSAMVLAATLMLIRFMSNQTSEAVSTEGS